MKKRLTLYVFAFIVLLAGCILGGNILDNFLFPKEPWKLEDINKTLQVGVPANASDISINGYTERAFSSLDLSFTVPQYEATKFGNQFCNGVLHPGYDPINAVDSFTASANAIFMSSDVSVAGISYYSYSSNTPSTVLGNRCMFNGAPILIKIDEYDPNATKVRFHMFNPCGSVCSPDVVLKDYASVR